MSIFSSMCAPVSQMNEASTFAICGSVASSSSPPSSGCSSDSSSPSSTQGISWAFASDPTATQAFLPSQPQFPSTPSVGEGAFGGNLSRWQGAGSATPELRNDQRTPCSDDGEGQSMSEDSTADGMTPTPSGKETQFGKGGAASDDLSDLLDDLDSCLPLGFDIEDLDAVDISGKTGSSYSVLSGLSSNSSTSEHHAATIPSFASNAEASSYINVARCDIDMEVQRCLRTYEKSECLNASVQKWQKEGQLTEEQRLVALKSLVHEAGNRHLRSLKRRTYKDGSAPAPRSATPALTSRFRAADSYESVKVRTHSAWRTIEENVVSDHSLYGYQTPQRNLSCMCIFNPTLVDTTSSPDAPAPLPCPYGENDDERSQRSVQQAATARTLQMQSALFKRNNKEDESSNKDKPYLFLNWSESSSSTKAQCQPRAMRPVAAPAAATTSVAIPAAAEEGSEDEDAGDEWPRHYSL